jgi:hypothetical protein
VLGCMTYRRRQAKIKALDWLLLEPYRLFEHHWQEACINLARLAKIRSCFLG